MCYNKMMQRMRFQTFRTVFQLDVKYFVMISVGMCGGSFGYFFMMQNAGKHGYQNLSLEAVLVIYLQDSVSKSTCHFRFGILSQEVMFILICWVSVSILIPWNKLLSNNMCSSVQKNDKYFSDH